MKITLRLWAAVGCLVLSQGCQSTGKADVEREFFRVPMDERRELLLGYSMEQQVDLYLSAMVERHPPDLALADVLATHGVDIVPLLKQRLADTDDRGLNKLHLIDVFVRMQQAGHYDVADDDTTMILLEQEAASIQDDQWRRMSLENIERLKKTSRLRK